MEYLRDPVRPGNRLHRKVEFVAPPWTTAKCSPGEGGTNRERERETQNVTGMLEAWTACDSSHD